VADFQARVELEKDREDGIVLQSFISLSQAGIDEVSLIFCLFVFGRLNGKREQLPQADQLL
jgi:hypothetical protein